MLAAGAFLVILLGLMIQLSRDVRHRSADQLTRQTLRKLQTALDNHPDIQSLLETRITSIKSFSKTSEGDLKQLAAQNNQVFLSLFKEKGYIQEFKEFPLSIYDGTSIKDAWGTPIVYWPSGMEGIGMAAQKRSFFISAGPDRSLGTLSDNLLSYEK